MINTLCALKRKEPKLIATMVSFNISVTTPLFEITKQIKIENCISKFHYFVPHLSANSSSVLLRHHSIISRSFRIKSELFWNCQTIDISVLTHIRIHINSICIVRTTGINSVLTLYNPYKTLSIASIALWILMVVCNILGSLQGHRWQ